MTSDVAGVQTMFDEGLSWEKCVFFCGGLGAVLIDSLKKEFRGLFFTTYSIIRFCWESREIFFW